VAYGIAPNRLQFNQADQRKGSRSPRRKEFRFFFAALRLGAFALNLLTVAAAILAALNP